MINIILLYLIYKQINNQMVYTNPGGISNSGSKYFVSQRGMIEKMNLNLIVNGDSQYYYVESQNNKTYSNTPTAINQQDYSNELVQQRLASRLGKLNKRLND